MKSCTERARCSTRCPGDVWQKYATLRTLFAFMWGHPGKKLLFMGAEIGQWREWNHDGSLDWHLLDEPAHAGLRQFVQALNWHYRTEPALYECDFSPAGFRWIDCTDNENSVVSFVRLAKDPKDAVLMVFNFTPVPRADYRIGVREPGFYAELLNSDSRRLWRQRRRQCRRRAERADPGARLRALDPPAGAAARLPAAETAVLTAGTALEPSPRVARYVHTFADLTALAQAMRRRSTERRT